MAEENFHDLGKETDFQIQEAQRVPSKMNRRHIIIQLVKAKETILKAVRKFNIIQTRETTSAHHRFFSSNFIGQKGVA